MRERVAVERETPAPTPARAAPATAPGPAAATASTSLLGLQRAAGNQATVALLQRKADATTGTATATTATTTSGGGNATGLPASLKAGIESLSGLSMDHVQVHYNSSKPAQLNALAYAEGAEIHLAPGQERHLPHEAWHVVQQAQGRVKPTMPADPALQAEAEQMGAKAEAHTPASTSG